MKRRVLIVVWGSAVLFALFIQTSLGDPLRALSIDTLVWLRDGVMDHGQSKGEPAVAIIAVDEKTYRTAPFRGTPRVAWSQHLATVIEALLDAGATVIGFDIVLSTSLDAHLPGIDRELLEVLHQGSHEDRVVLGEILHGRERIQPYFGYRAVVGFEKNIRPLDVIMDPDGIVRRMPLSLPAPSTDNNLDTIPSLALELAHRAQEQSTRQKNWRWGGELTGDLADRKSTHPRKTSIINLHRHNIDVPTYSLADLYHCTKIDDFSYFVDHFSDKVVLIGSALDVEDQVLSSARFILPELARRPIDRCTTPDPSDVLYGLNGPTMPGVYLHAAMVQNLLDGDLLKTVSPVVHGILTVLAAGGLMMVGIIFHPIPSLPLLGLTIAFITVGSSITFASNILIYFLMPVAGSIAGYAGGLSLHLFILERARRRIRHAFNHLLPANVVEQLMDRNEFPSGGGKLITCTVLLTDLENYTGLAEQLKPDELLDVLNQVNQALGKAIEHHGGIVSWHAGDSLLALFGAPIECADHATQGVKAALDCCAAVDRINIPQLLRYGGTPRVRIGISTGEVLIGYIGSNRHLTYSAIGDHVNIASRLEGLNKIYGTSVLANETTYAFAAHDFGWRKVDNTCVKGRTSSISVFEPRRIPENDSPKRINLLPRHRNRPSH